jgi:hypothetical protein
MKTKLLRKLRKRFKFTEVHGYSEMLDMKTGRVYGPEWKYARSRYSVKEHNLTIAIMLLTGIDRWEDAEIKIRRRRANRYYEQVVNA